MALDKWWNRPPTLAQSHAAIVVCQARRPARDLLRLVTICELCLDAEGEECHTPGCLFWMQSVPDQMCPGWRDLYPLANEEG